MGMFSFAKDIGDKIFNRDDEKHDAKTETKADANMVLQILQKSVVMLKLKLIVKKQLSLSVTCKTLQKLLIISISKKMHLNLRCIR